jgi:hypothetical protein
MKKKIGLLLVAIIALSSFCCFQFLFSRTGYHPTDNIESLMISENDFPKGWKFDYLMPITGDFNWGTENRSKHFVIEPERGSAREYIYRFDNIYKSMDAYYSLKKDLFLVKENRYSFLTYQSQVANDWYFACDYNNFNGPMCDSLGRYEDYIIYFSISADKETLTSDQLQKILQSIDDRMKTFLEK